MGPPLADDTSPFASGLDSADLAALGSLLELAMAQTEAVGAAWVGADGHGLLLACGNPALAKPDARHDAATEGRVYAQLLLWRPAPMLAPGVVGLLGVAAALLRARAQAESSRLEAERLLEAGRAASDWLWETNAEGHVVWMTESISVLTGRTAAEEIGSRPLDQNRVRTDEYAASYDRYLMDRAARRPIRELVLDRDTLDGTITVSINGEPRFDADGRFLGYRGATRNITAELRARTEARRAQQLLQQTLEGMPAGVMISGPDDRILMANARWRSAFGKDLPPECQTWPDVIRHHVRAGHYPDAVGREDEYVAWCLAQASEAPEPVEMQWRDQWVMSADRRLSDGSIVHLSIYVTERKRAEMALAHAEDRWRFALDGAGHGVWDWDHETGIYFSPSWKSMLGHADDEISNQRREWIGRIHPDDRAGALAEFNRHRRGETAVYETEYRLQRKDGRYIWVHDRGRAIRRDADGWPLRVIGTHSDITRQRLADQALHDKQAAEMVSRSMSEFLSRMSHEMRTPLNAVIGFAELLHLRGEYRADKVEHILAAGRHLLDLINDVLDLQQVEQGGLALRSTAVDAAALASDVEALLRPQAHKLALATQVEDMEGVHVRADAQRLRQVLLNLGSNAIKYNRPGGQVRWHADRSDARRWGIVTQDSGPGLEPAQLARLFRPFERLGRETSGIEGSGLGLVIARRLVEAMAGELTIHSEPGQGTHVTVWLPRADASAMMPAALATPVLAASQMHDQGELPGRPIQVLYVEDNPLNALLFEEALRRHPELSLRVAADGKEALALAAQWQPDLLVIDMHLPGATGTEVLRALRRLPDLGAVPAVMCSADAMPEDRERALAEGFADYWTKPLDVRRLGADIRVAVERTR
jgi:PAS domain S-box-containing protein